MTRKDKVEFLIKNGEQITYHIRQSDKRFYIDTVKVNSKTIEKFTTKIADQKKAEQLLDILLYELRLEGIFIEGGDDND